MRDREDIIDDDEDEREDELTPSSEGEEDHEVEYSERQRSGKINQTLSIKDKHKSLNQQFGMMDMSDDKRKGAVTSSLDLSRSTAAGVISQKKHHKPNNLMT